MKRLFALFLLLPLAACGSCADPFTKLSDCPKGTPGHHRESAVLFQLTHLLLAVLVLYLLAAAVLAQPAYAATASVQPLYDLGNQVLQAVLEGLAMAVSGWLMYVFHRYVTPYLGAQMEAKARDSLNIALANGVAIAMSKVDGAEKLHTNVEVKGAVASWAAQYAIDHAPQAVSKFGLNPNDLALKALAFIPAPPTVVDTTGITVPQPAPVQVAPLGPVKQ